MFVTRHLTFVAHDIVRSNLNTSMVVMETERDAILREHASDVANTVCCNMSKEEASELRDRLLARLKRLEKIDLPLATLIRRGIDVK